MKFTIKFDYHPHHLKDNLLLACPSTLLAANTDSEFISIFINPQNVVSTQMKWKV